MELFQYVYNTRKDSIEYFDFTNNLDKYGWRQLGRQLGFSKQQLDSVFINSKSNGILIDWMRRPDATVQYLIDSLKQKSLYTSILYLQRVLSLVPKEPLQNASLNNNNNEEAMSYEDDTPFIGGCMTVVADIPDGPDSVPALVLNRRLWPPNTTLYVYFMKPKKEHLVLIDKVMNYAKLWETPSTIKFVKSDIQQPNAPEIRITFEGRPAFSSEIGQLARSVNKDKPTMHLAGLTNPKITEAEFRRHVLHEFGHALGLLHEHEHPKVNIPWDEAKAREYFHKNGMSYEAIQQNMFDKTRHRETLMTEFDIHSIMRYPVPKDLLVQGPERDIWVNAGLESLPTELSETDKAVFKLAHNKMLNAGSS